MPNIEEMTELEIAQRIVDLRDESEKAVEVIQLENLKHEIKLDNGKSIKVNGRFSFYLKKAKERFEQ